MNNYQQQYKKKPMGFTDAITGRVVRSVKLEQRRKVNRAENFARHRDVPEAKVINECTLERAAVNVKLQRWKLERDVKRKMDTDKKKPAFKVGVVHHKFYSPPVTNRTRVNSEPCHGKNRAKHRPTPTKRITRATQKRLEAKLAGSSVTPAMPSTSSIKAKCTKSTQKRLSSLRKEAMNSFAPKNYSFKPPTGLTEIPLFGRFAIPSEATVDKPSAETDIEHDSEDEKEKPWPVVIDYPSMDTSFQMRNPLVRQDATEQLNSGLLEEPSQGNSSIETVTLRLSSEDDSPVETDVSDEKKINSEILDAIKDHKDIDGEDTIDDSEVVEAIEKIDEPDAEELAEITKAIAVDTTTPPRSGTPVPASFSPYVVSSRGKVSARKEQQMKMGIRRSSSGNIPMKDTVMQNMNISVEEEERTAQYFKFILQREIDRLTEMCNKWVAIMNEPDLPEDAQYQINQAVGQTNLLIRKKFERFRRLVLDCETGKGEMLVQCKDLQGFWEMMYMEVKDCESRFLKLDFLKSKGWVEEQIAVKSKKVTRKKAAPTMPKISAKSSARSWILAARKKKMSQEEDVHADGVVIVVNDTEPKTSKNGTTQHSKDRSLRRSLKKSSPAEDQNRRQNTPKTTSKKTPTSLLKKVQLSEASKSIRSPLAVMKISKMCKTPEVRLDDTISYVNSDQTPGKGILKKSEDSSSQESCPPKSTRKVDFNDDIFLEEVSVENEINEELQNSIDLGRALARIDAYDEDDSNDIACDIMQHVTLRKVEKRLDFEDDSFNETENTDTAESAAVVAAIPESKTIPIINIVPVTPLRLAPDNVQSSLKSKRRSSRRMNKVLEASIQEDNLNDTSSDFRVLRNRTVTTEKPYKSNRRSIKSTVIDKDNISHNLSTKENNDPLDDQKTRSNSEVRNNATEKPESEVQTKRRRSTRKSVRFNSGDCTACAPKPVHPMTPHIRRSRKVSLLGDSAPESVVPPTNGDLMSFESPAQLPARVRKSSFK